MRALFKSNGPLLLLGTLGGPVTDKAAAGASAKVRNRDLTSRLGWYFGVAEPVRARPDRPGSGRGQEP